MREKTFLLLIKALVRAFPKQFRSMLEIAGYDLLAKLDKDGVFIDDHENYAEELAVIILEKLKKNKYF